MPEQKYIDRVRKYGNMTYEELQEELKTFLPNTKYMAVEELEEFAAVNFEIRWRAYQNSLGK